MVEINQSGCCFSHVCVDLQQHGACVGQTLVLSTQVAIYLSIYLSISLFINLCIYLSIFQFVYLSIIYVSIYLSIYLPIYLPALVKLWFFSSHRYNRPGGKNKQTEPDCVIKMAKIWRISEKYVFLVEEVSIFNLKIDLVAISWLIIWVVIEKFVID